MNGKRCVDDEVVIVSENIPNPPVIIDDDLLIVSQKIRKKRRISTSNLPSPIPTDADSTTIPQPPPPVVPDAPKVSRSIDCVICKQVTPTCESVVIGPCSCAACRTCMAKNLKDTIKVPVVCTGCFKPLDIWKAVAEIGWQDAEAGGRLERLAIMAMLGENVKACYACHAPFEYNGDGTKSSAGVTCPLCQAQTCVLCEKAWHTDECARNCPNCGKSSDVRGTVDCVCGVKFCTRCGIDCGKLEEHECVQEQNEENE